MSNLSWAQLGGSSAGVTHAEVVIQQPKVTSLTFRHRSGSFSQTSSPLLHIASEPPAGSTGSSWLSQSRFPTVKTEAAELLEAEPQKPPNVTSAFCWPKQVSRPARLMLGRLTPPRDERSRKIPLQWGMDGAKGALLLPQHLKCVHHVLTCPNPSTDMCPHIPFL